MDRLAKIMSTFIKSLSGTTAFWTIADAANDESYENYIRGFDLTELDRKLEEAVTENIEFYSMFLFCDHSLPFLCRNDNEPSRA